MNNNLVSIITPAYNSGRFISECIESVIAQTYQDWEMIIVDDCSSDDTQNIINNYTEKEQRIIYLKNEKNLGSAESRNIALRHAKGKWIAFLDSDDVWLPEKLERQIEFMRKNDYHFSYTNYCEIDENSRETGVLLTGPKIITENKMKAYCWPGCLTVIYDSEYVGLIQCPDLKINEEYALWIRIARKTSCHLLEENLAKYRRHNKSVSNQSYIKLIKWHYLLFRRAEDKSIFASLVLTLCNVIFGTFKKLFYRRKYKVS